MANIRRFKQIFLELLLLWLFVKCCFCSKASRREDDGVKKCRNDPEPPGWADFKQVNATSNTKNLSAVSLPRLPPIVYHRNDSLSSVYYKYSPDQPPSDELIIECLLELDDISDHLPEERSKRHDRAPETSTADVVKGMIDQEKKNTEEAFPLVDEKTEAKRKNNIASRKYRRKRKQSADESIRQEKKSKQECDVVKLKLVKVENEAESIYWLIANRFDTQEKIEEEIAKFLVRHLSNDTREFDFTNEKKTLTKVLEVVAEEESGKKKIKEAVEDLWRKIGPESLQNRYVKAQQVNMATF